MVVIQIAHVNPHFFVNSDDGNATLWSKVQREKILGQLFDIDRGKNHSSKIPVRCGDSSNQTCKNFS